MTWKGGGERLFGYSADEAVGQRVTLLISDDRLFEEDDFLARQRRGERVHHFETVRRSKSGERIDISLTVSPVRDARGVIIGASKIDRDIFESKRALTRYQTLLREMNQRIMNLFSLTAGLVSLSARATTGGDALAADLKERLHSLSRARPDDAGPDRRSRRRGGDDGADA